MGQAVEVGVAHSEGVADGLGLEADNVALWQGAGQEEGDGALAGAQVEDAARARSSPS